MLNTKNWGNTSTLLKPIGVADNTLRFLNTEVGKFTVPNGDYYYLVIRSNGVREIVKVVDTTGGVLTVVRAQDNTVAQSFPKGACVAVEWSPQQLCEYIQLCANGDSVTGLNGVHCIECGTCVTLDGGKIVDITGEQTC